MFKPKRIIYFAGGAEEANASLEHAESNKDANELAAQLAAVMEAPDKLSNSPDKAYEEAQQALTTCDESFLSLTSSSAYSNPEAAEGKLIQFCKATPFLRAALAKYESEQNRGGTQQPPRPDLLVEEIANATYGRYNTHFTDSRGHTNNERGSKVEEYMWPDKASDSQIIERARQVKSTFTTVHEGIKAAAA
jgi:hypothetical protein